MYVCMYCTAVKINYYLISLKYMYLFHYYYFIVIHSLLPCAKLELPGFFSLPLPLLGQARTCVTPPFSIYFSWEHCPLDILCSFLSVLFINIISSASFLSLSVFIGVFNHE